MIKNQIRLKVKMIHFGILKTYQTGGTKKVIKKKEYLKIIDIMINKKMVVIKTIRKSNKFKNLQMINGFNLI